MIQMHLFFRRLWRILSIVICAAMMVSISSSFIAYTTYTQEIPVPIYPENYDDTTPTTDPPLGIPSFIWSAVNGASIYRLQVARDINFSNPIAINVTTANTAYTPSSTIQLLADGEWYWRVRVDEPTPAGLWSEASSFIKTWATEENKPALIAPEDGASLAFFKSPDFSWTQVMGAAKYRFQIATSEDGFNTPIFSEDTLTPMIQPVVRLENRAYYWRVIPIDAVEHLGTTSVIRKFIMAYGTYAMGMVPELLEPGGQDSLPFTPTFHWTAIEGAETYHLEYTTDKSCDFSIGTSIETRQTFYTPVDIFPNQEYCWHVRVESGPAVGEWSETRKNTKQWDLQPQLLTPTNKYSSGLYPLYSWTPVPGASRYRIDIARDAGFTDLVESFETINTTYAPQEEYIRTHYFYWRVTPIDASGEDGLPSVVFEYQSNDSSTAPILVYPLHYYIPNDPEFHGDDYPMNPVEDRTVAYPIFIWHRVMNPTPYGGVFTSTYRIQVATTANFGADIVWEYDTENTSATPIDNDDFSPEVEQDYFWHVCVLDHLGGSCLEEPYAGWSQTWRARFNPSYDPDDLNPWVLPPTQGRTPELLRPTHGQEYVEATPLLEWWPYLDVTQIQYQVEISRDANFSNHVISETVNIPAYAPSYSIAQRSLGRTDYGTFYWRVRGFDGSTWSEWSEPWRFQIASQSEWRYIRTLGEVVNRLLIGVDPVNDTSETYDLSTLYAAQQGGYPPDGIPAYWFLGFTATLTSTDMTYVFYIDLDHVDGSGADIPPEHHDEDPYLVTTIPAHQPEYAIYVDKIGGEVNAQHTYIYAWNGSEWGNGQSLYAIGGFVHASTNYVELQLPNDAIDMNELPSSICVMLFSVDPTTGILQDSVPSDEQLPGATQLSHFSAVSDRMNLISPASTVSGDLRTLPAMLPFFWDWPAGGNPSTPWAGGKLEVHSNPSYNNLIADFSIDSADTYFGENNVTFLDDLIGDDIYYWRVQPRYWTYGHDKEIYGAWSGGWSFRRSGFTAQNLQTSVTWATPTFSWDKVEGANTYWLQVSTVSNFGTTIIDEVTPMNSYTPITTLSQGIYYWRVKVIRYNNLENDWSNVVVFNLSQPTPTGLTPDQEFIHYAPTFCWDPLIKYNEEDPHEPIMAVAKYKVQVSRDEDFSMIYDSVTTHNNCWTPTSGYLDGTYWWHVAMIDGNGEPGPYSPAATFSKQYPITPLVKPISGSIPEVPTFIWTPVDGAATYRFQVSLYSTFSPLLESIDTINTQFTSTKIYSRNQGYYWRVAIEDRNGNLGTFTAAFLEGQITGLMATNDSPTVLGETTILTATIDTGTNVSYKWDYGDGSLSDLISSGDVVTTTHLYPDVGSYTAIVTASNPLGDEFVVTTVVTIIEPLNQDKFIFLPVIFILNPK